MKTNKIRNSIKEVEQEIFTVVVMKVGIMVMIAAQIIFITALITTK